MMHKNKSILPAIIVCFNICQEKTLVLLSVKKNFLQLHWRNEVFDYYIIINNYLL